MSQEVSRTETALSPDVRRLPQSVPTRRDARATPPRPAPSPSRLQVSKAPSPPQWPLEAVNKARILRGSHHQADSCLERAFLNQDPVSLETEMQVMSFQL